MASYLIQRCEPEKILDLLNNDSIFLFRLVKNMLNVQYLNKIGFYEIFLVLLFAISSFSVIEIFYMIVLFIILIGALFATKNRVYYQRIIILHLLFLSLVLLEVAYYSKIAFDVFYQVQMELSRALSLARSVSLICGILIGVVLVFFILQRLVKRFKKYKV